ncbi:MAG: FAD-dependent oxidoreductase, partial [Elusimicrobiota bacterium]
LNGALLDQRKSFGYNATFRYPLRGGSQALPDALAARVRDLRLGARVLRVDLEQKIALIEGLGEVRYERLVNTLPLDDFLDLASPLPASVRAARAHLRRISVYNLNLGVARGGISPMHWAYFPEDRFVFYRVGFQSNFAKTVAPRGATSIYIEISRRPEEKVSLDRLESQALQGLRSTGLLKSSDRLLTRLWIPIGCAYVVYDKHRSASVAAVMRHLESVGAYSIGRWGGWKYSFMEETILDGKRCAEKLLGLTGVQAPDESQAELVPLK